MIHAPAKTGNIEIGEGQGRCVIDGCKVKGGGLIRVQNTTSDVAQLPDLAWKGKRIVICGKHLLEVLTAVLILPEDG